MILFVGIFAIFSVSFAAHRLAENVTTMTDANINNITVQPRVDSKDIDFSFSFNQNLVTFVRIKGEGRREAISGNMIYDQGVWLRDLGTKQEKLIMANGDISFLPFAERTASKSLATPMCEAASIRLGVSPISKTISSSILKYSFAGVPTFAKASRTIIPS